MPDHLTPGVHPFTPDDLTDQITARSMELQLQGWPASAALARAESEARMTFERASDIQRRQALVYLAEHANDPDLPEDWRRVIVNGIGPFG